MVRLWRTDINHIFEKEAGSTPDFVLSFILRDPFDHCLHFCLDLDDHKKLKSVWNDLEKGDGKTLSKQDLLDYIQHHSPKIQCEGLRLTPYFEIIKNELNQPDNFSQAFLSLLHLFPYPLDGMALKALDMTIAPFMFKKYLPFTEYDSISGFLKAEKGLVYGLHIHDNNGRNDHISLGSGRIDFSFLTEIDKPDSPLILEVGFNNHYADFKRNYTKLMELVEKG